MKCQAYWALTKFSLAKLQRKQGNCGCFHGNLSNMFIITINYKTQLSIYLELLYEISLCDTTRLVALYSPPEF